jgi:hypothetical protein
MKDTQITILLTLIDQAFDHKSWHGTNLNGSIRGLTATDAAWRLSPNRHNIWEIVVHAAYWKYIVRRRLLSEAKGSFPLKGSNWIKRPEGRVDERKWKKDVELLKEMHKGLREAIAGISSKELEYKPSGGKVSNLELITGIASHDLYHAGQIQLLKRERRNRSEAQGHV